MPRLDLNFINYSKEVISIRKMFTIFNAPDKYDENHLWITSVGNNIPR